MNREIKFKGKSLSTGEWEYGYYAVHHISLTDIDHKTNQIIRVGTSVVHSIFNDGRKDEGGYWKDVVPETVGQFTGFLDKNENEIYEGDVLQINPTPHGRGFVRWHDKEAHFVVQMLLSEQWYGIAAGVVEICGNIHDPDCPCGEKGGEQ